MSGKSLTIGDFTFCRPSQILPIYRISPEVCPRFASNATLICGRATGGQQLGDIYRRRTPTSPTVQICLFISSVGNDRRPSQKSGRRRENRNTPDSPDLSPFIPDDRGHLRFRVSISWQDLGRSGNSKIPDRLGFSRHMKTRLKNILKKKLNLEKLTVRLGLTIVYFPIFLRHGLTSSGYIYN